MCEVLHKSSYDAFVVGLVQRNTFVLPMPLSSSSHRPTSELSGNYCSHGSFYICGYMCHNAIWTLVVYEINRIFVPTHLAQAL